MSTRKPSLQPSAEDFIANLIAVESQYQAARSLYERISKDTGWAEHPNRDALLEEIVVQGRQLRTVCDRAISEWFSGA